MDWLMPFTLFQDVWFLVGSFGLGCLGGGFWVHALYAGCRGVFARRWRSGFIENDKKDSPMSHSDERKEQKHEDKFIKQKPRKNKIHGCVVLAMASWKEINS